MIATALAIAAGLASVALLVALARGLRAEHWLYAASLPVLPAIYAGFAAWAGATAVAGLELQAGLPYLAGGVLLVGLGRSRPVAAMAATAVLWLVHGGYDALHPALFDNPGVPAWYPAYCACIDVVLGLYLLGLALRGGGLQPPRNGVTSK